MDIMRSVVGMVVLLAIAFLLSVNKKSISLRTVGAALLLQIAIGGGGGRDEHSGLAGR